MAGRFNRIAWRGFDTVFAPWMRHHLRISMIGSAPAPLGSGPVILVSNHVSWWDGFLLHEIQKRIRPHSPLYTIALERELSAHPVLRLIGGVGMTPSSPSSILRAMRGLQERIAEDPDSMIGFFPQGCIAPSFRRPLGFTRGIELFARKIGNLTIIPVALHIEPLTGMAPTAFVHIGEPRLAPNGEVDAESLQSDVTGLLDATLAGLSLHGEDSVRAMSDAEASSAYAHRATHRATHRTVEAQLHGNHHA